MDADGDAFEEPDEDNFSSLVENLNISDEKSRLKRAIILYIKASHLERDGDLGKALKFYRKSFALKQDVQSFIDPKLLLPSASQSLPIGHQMMWFEQSVLLKSLDISDPICHQKKMNICDLPNEIIIEIFRRIGVLHPKHISRISMVCKLWFALSQEELLWEYLIQQYYASRMHTQSKLLHEYISLSNVVPKIQSSPLSGSNFRSIFFNMPMLRTDGIYICRIRYMRPGTDDFAFHQPVHIVTYYRYLRFFENGHMSTLLTTEKPPSAIDMLRSYRPQFTAKGVSITHGSYYLIIDNNVHKIFIATQDPHRKTLVFCATLQLTGSFISDINKLKLLDFRCIDKERDIVSPYDLSQMKSFIFSPVRSYSN